MNDDKLKVLKSNAVKAYEATTSDGKTLLEKLWPGEFKPVLITDQIKTFADVLEYHSINPADFTLSIEGLSADEAAYKRIKLIAAALNEGEVDPANTWYTPYFNRDAGFGFSGTYYECWNASTHVGSRLSYKTADLAIYAGKTFKDIYKPFILNLKQ